MLLVDSNRQQLNTQLIPNQDLNNLVKSIPIQPNCQTIAQIPQKNSLQGEKPKWQQKIKKTTKETGLLQCITYMDAYSDTTTTLMRIQHYKEKKNGTAPNEQQQTVQSNLQNQVTQIPQQNVEVQQQKDNQQKQQTQNVVQQSEQKTNVFSTTNNTNQIQQQQQSKQPIQPQISQTFAQPAANLQLQQTPTKIQAFNTQPQPQPQIKPKSPIKDKTTLLWDKYSDKLQNNQKRNIYKSYNTEKNPYDIPYKQNSYQFNFDPMQESQSQYTRIQNKKQQQQKKQAILQQQQSSNGSRSIVEKNQFKANYNLSCINTHTIILQLQYPENEQVRIPYSIKWRVSDLLTAINDYISNIMDEDEFFENRILLIRQRNQQTYQLEPETKIKDIEICENTIFEVMKKKSNSYPTYQYVKSNNNNNKQQNQHNNFVDPQKLPKMGQYQSKPNFFQLSRMTEQELQNVQNFIIFNEFGSIKFETSVNLCNVNFEQIVIIQQDYINIYPEQRSKIENRLNQPAILTFKNFGKNKFLNNQQNKNTIQKIVYN